MAAFLARRASLGDNPIKYVRNYSESRGMHFSYDAHDWLGGYPYETSGPSELIERTSVLGFAELRSFPLPRTLGLFGSGCAEFVFERNQDTGPR